MASLDIRQLFAGVLTFSMLVMLANMIKKDYFDPATVDHMTTADLGYNAVSDDQTRHKLLTPNSGPWKASVEVKPCWEKPIQTGRWDQPKGYITFSLTGAPHHHLLQVTNAVMITKQVKATLLLPVMIGNEAETKRAFTQVYDDHNFVTSLEGVVKIAYHQPTELSTKELPVARIPYVVSRDYVTSIIEPLFKRKGNLKLVTDFSTLNVTLIEEMKYMKSVSCMVVFEALRWQPALQELVNSVLKKLKTINPRSDGRIIAVDWRTEMLGMKRCQGNAANGSNNCFSAERIGQFLKKIGFETNTTIYLTQNGWDYRLDQLTNIYPNTYTKESLIPPNTVANYSKFTDEIDFYICSHSDVFVPMFSPQFYAGVVGKRIALGKTQILDPTLATSSNDADYISPYVSEKSHWAYSCFC